MFEGEEKDILPGFQELKCRMIFYIKMRENFRRKARMVAGGHTIEAPSYITYSSVVSRDSVRIALTIAALNNLDVLACDIQNTYLTAQCREKIWTRTGPEFGSEIGCIMIVVRSLYGLKSSGAAFRALLAETLYVPMEGPTNIYCDNEAVWSRSSSRWDFNFHSYVLTIYVCLY